MRAKSVLCNIIVCLFILTLALSYEEPPPSKTLLFGDGNPSRHINLVFIGSGYTQNELTYYRNSVDANVTKLWTVNWFNTNQSLFNIWRIDAVSPQSGQDLDDAAIFRLSDTTPHNFIVVIHNSLGQESAVKPYIELRKDSHNYVVLAHELGHTIGGLADEYSTPATAYLCDGLSKRHPNAHDKPNNEKWSDLVMTAPFEGARYCKNNLWRPSENSIMLDSANCTFFDAVGLKAMDLGAGKIIGSVESTLPNLQIKGLSDGDKKSDSFTVEAITSDNSGIERVEFYLAKAGDTSKSVKIDRTPPYNTVIDTTSHENGNYFIDVVSYDVNWNYVRKTTSFTISNEFSSFEVPLQIKETAGVERVKELCSTGVPLEKGFAQDTSSIAVYDKDQNVIPAQFKILERWNEWGQDNSIKWLLVTFRADVPPSGSNTYFLRSGSNPKPGNPVTIQETGDAFLMGGQKFMKDFSAPFDITLMGENASLVHHANDLETIRWTIVEEGPLRTCLKAESETESGKFGFIAWIYAFAGQSRWDMTLVLKNTPRTANGPLYFKDFSISWNRSGSSFIFGVDGANSYSGNLISNDRAYLYQDSSGTDRWDKLGEQTDGQAGFVINWTDLWKKGIPAFRGFRIFKNADIMAQGNQAPGWVSLDDSSLLVRNFWQNNPIALEVSPNHIAAKLLPQYWTGHNGLHWLDDLQRKAYDISFRTGMIKDSDAKAFNSPLIIHCGLKYYRSEKIEEALGYISNRYTESAPNSAALGLLEYNWVNFGGAASDKIRRRYRWLPKDSFVRTSNPFEAQKLWIYMRHSATITPLWADDYVYPRDANVLRPYTYTNQARSKGKYKADTDHHSYMPWNPQHWSVNEVFDGYRLFGDPLAIDAVEKMGVYLQFYVDYRASHPPEESRWDALPMSALCEIYRLTSNQSILNSIKKYLDIMENTIHKNRGYYAPNAAGNEKPFMIAKVTDGLAEAFKITNDRRAFDMIVKLTDYVIAEGYINQCVLYEVPIDPQARDHKLLNARQAAPGACNSPQNTNVQEMTRPLAWCYLHTGNSKYKQVLDEIVAGAKAIRYYNSMMGDQSWSNWGPVVDYVYEKGIKVSKPAPPSNLAIYK